ncbi:hypothetical protein JL193_04135 [Polaribacter batillariae]|uniref:Uncharacterized protein n=1 Tax=Polaribacter batillariae TaxID=2808900 RepID=A0ABX7SW55_9FLAO|nr:hypothetical protein [Polaribacter batillariae]QTD38485.1 hypothetical protein JL193_04135 [Polaribacter batillariae]
MKIVYLYPMKFKIIFCLLFIFATNATSMVKNRKNTRVVEQDYTVLIKKIKAKIAFLKEQREKFKTAKKWSLAKEKKYQKQVKTLEKNLERLGYKAGKELTVEEKIKKLQKQLKYINNNRVNKNAKNTWTKKDDSIYEKKASKLIDSIIKLRMIKE